MVNVTGSQINGFNMNENQRLLFSVIKLCAEDRVNRVMALDLSKDTLFCEFS